MLVSLYTVRVVLEALGAEDYGIYNVVAGVVTMFSFLSGAMAMASQRYFSFEIGKGDFEQLKKIFSLNLLIYFLIAIVVLLLAETIGLWFISNKLLIPLERKLAAVWLYQFSMVSFLFTIMTSPYMAMIIAREDMNVYAYVSIVEAVLKLGVVFILRLILWDKLTLYGMLMLSVAIIITTIYRIVCARKYQEGKFKFYWNTDLFKEIMSYTGWNMFGASVGIFKNQIMNILLNQFFNPVVIVARSIAASVNGAIASFSHNFNTAMRPQIIKSYAAGKKEEMLSLMFRGAKGAYLLMYLFVLPLMLEVSVVLTLWLKNPPEYAVFFTRLALLDVLIESMSYPIMTAAQATGKIKLYQSVVGGILLLNLPISWMVLLLGTPPYSVMIVSIVITFVAFIVRLFILKRLVDFSVWQFVKKVCMPITIISITSAILPVIIFLGFKQGLFRLFFLTGVSVISVCLFSYTIGLNGEERMSVRKVISSHLHLRKI
jgi:O-antigen/teichoic acid export membrane protein